MAKYRIGVDVGGTKIAFGLFGETSEVLERDKIATDCGWSQEDFVRHVAEQIRSLIERIPEDGELTGIALVFPSSVDHRQGIVGFTPTITSLNGFRAVDAFEREFPGVRIVIDSDTNAAALAEYRCGAGRGHDDMVFTAISTGIGSGLILNGQLYRGAGGAAGETGHMIIDPDEEDCYCGCGNAGCFMGKAAGSCVSKRVIRDVKAGVSTVMRELVEDPDAITAFTIREACDMNDSYALKVVHECARYIGLCLYNTYCVLNVKCFILGGGLTNFGDLLIEDVKATFYEYLEHMHGKDAGVSIQLAETGGHMGIIGAAELLR